MLFPVSFLLVRLVLAPVQLIQHCPLSPSKRPRLGVSCDTRAWLAVPFLYHRAEEVLTPMDFSFVDSAESMFCFCLLRQGPWINISFHHSFSLYVSACVCVFLCVFLLIFRNLFPTAFGKPHPLFAIAASLSFLVSPVLRFLPIFWHTSRDCTSKWGLDSNNASFFN